MMYPSTGRIWIGIDPGFHGALARVDDLGLLAEVVSMPLFVAERQGKIRHTLNVPAIAAVLRQWAADRPREAPAPVVAIEQVSAMPPRRKGKDADTVCPVCKQDRQDKLRMGATSAFNFGCQAGILQGVVGAIGLPLHLVMPVVWKRHQHLLGTAKDAARVLATHRFPSLVQKLARIKDGGRADALLIADYARAKQLQ